MDSQAGFPDLFDDPSGVVDRAAALLDAARDAGRPVVHLRVAFPTDGPPVPGADRVSRRRRRPRPRRARSTWLD